jgi:hypothetical protein
VFTGHLGARYGERSWYVVVLPLRSYKAVADRVAKTIDAINGCADDYLTVMRSPTTARSARADRTSSRHSVSAPTVPAS